MFVVKNVIDPTQATKKVAIFCSTNQEYIALMSECDIRSYIIRHDQWPISLDQFSSNMRIVKTGDAVDSSIDCVICVGMADNYDHAVAYSKKNCVPLVLIRQTGDNTHIIYPYSTKINRRENIEADVIVDIIQPEESEATSDSMTVTIPPVEPKFEILAKRAYDNITVNANIPKEVLIHYKSMLTGLNVQPHDRKSPSSSDIYIETWVGDVIMPLRCMAAGSIVMLPDSQEARRIIDHEKNGFIYNDFQDMKENMIKILQRKVAGNLEEISENARKSAPKFFCSEEDFVSRWETIINLLCSTKSKLGNIL